MRGSGRTRSAAGGAPVVGSASGLRWAPVGVEGRPARWGAPGRGHWCLRAEHVGAHARGRAEPAAGKPGGLERACRSRKCDARGHAVTCLGVGSLRQGGAHVRQVTAEGATPGRSRGSPPPPNRLRRKQRRSYELLLPNPGPRRRRPRGRRLSYRPVPGESVSGAGGR